MSATHTVLTHNIRARPLRNLRTNCISRYSLRPLAFRTNSPYLFPALFLAARPCAIRSSNSSLFATASLSSAESCPLLFALAPILTACNNLISPVQPPCKNEPTPFGTNAFFASSSLPGLTACFPLFQSPTPPTTSTTPSCPISRSPNPLGALSCSASEATQRSYVS